MSGSPWSVSWSGDRYRLVTLVGGPLDGHVFAVLAGEQLPPELNAGEHRYRHRTGVLYVFVPDTG